jgi:hypothetical protein
LASIKSKLRPYRWILLTAALCQVAAVIGGMAFIYACASENPRLENPFGVSLYYGLVGPPYMMIIGAHVTVPVLGLILLLIWAGRRWKRARALWVLAVALWGVWWAFMAYVMCVD